MNAVLSEGKTDFSASQSLNQAIKISSNAEFFCLQFTDSYYNKKFDKFTVLAYINKKEAAQIYTSRINALMEGVNAYRNYAKDENEPFLAVNALHKAKVLSNLAEKYIHNEMIIVPSDTEKWQDSLKTISLISAEHNALKKDVTFSIHLTQKDQKFDPIFSTVAGILEKYGYAYSLANSNYKIIIDISCIEESYETGEFVRPSVDVHTEYWAVSDYIVDELAHYFTRRFGAGNVIAHDEFTRNLISREFEYQQSGAVSDETIQEIGRELGVDCVIIGDFTESVKYWNLFVKATQVETKKVLSSWKGKISKKDAEVKFQIEKSKKSSKPKIEAKSSAKSSGLSPQNTIGVSIAMINENGDEVTTLHPRDVIRFKVSADKNAYLAILCTDAHKEETWLPLQSNFIRAGESRIFPDIPGAVRRVEDGIFGNESVKVYAATVESDLPSQTKMMGTRAFKLSNENAETAEAVVNYRVEK